MRYVIIPQLRGRWIWELRNSSGQTVCQSAGSYISRERAFDVFQEVRAKAHVAVIVEEAAPAAARPPVPLVPPPGSQDPSEP